MMKTVGKDKKRQENRGNPSQRQSQRRRGAREEFRIKLMGRKGQEKKNKEQIKIGSRDTRGQTVNEGKGKTWREETGCRWLASPQPSAPTRS